MITMINNSEISYKSAEILLKLECVNFSTSKPFKLTSGKLSPVYCDCRRLISFPKERKLLIDFGIKKIKDKKNFPQISKIAGGESAGIPYATMIAERLNLPMTYIRKEKKKFGKNSQIEGILKKNDNVLLVEDLMTDGGSKLVFLKAIDSIGAQTKQIFVIFNYGIIDKFFNFKKFDIELISLTSWEFILEVGLKMKKIKKKEIEIIKNFLVTIGIRN
tara:strand:+ start:610 stop:1263 length:654 start_codon:yes stop_codon:yes gene_type:complete